VILMESKRLKRNDEKHLVLLAKNGNQNAFGQLYSTNIKRVFRYISRRVDNTQLAEDLTSDVFTHALTSIHRYEDRGKPFIAWLYSIARARVADYYRRLLRDPEIIHLDDVYIAVLPNLDTRLMQQELAGYMHKVIIALTEDQREVVVLRFGEDHSIKEVARIMCRQSNAVKQLQHRALRSMEKHLERSGFVVNEIWI
jgi:RNA polymerase sigma-70 factor, ECF subfamily